MFIMASIFLVLMFFVFTVGSENINAPITPLKYYLDSHADCDGQVREMYDRPVEVHGKSGAEPSSNVPHTCTLILRSASGHQRNNLLIEVIRVTIKQCDVHLTIYNGDPGEGTLNGYDCWNPAKVNERSFITSSDTVSFVLDTIDGSSQIDIEIVVTPSHTRQDTWDESYYGEDWGIHRKKLENHIAVIIVGTVYGITIFFVILGSCLFYRHYKNEVEKDMKSQREEESMEGLNKPWETNQLSSFHPEVPIHRTRSKSSDQRTLGNSSTHRQESSRFRSYGDRDRPSSPYSDEVFHHPPKKRLVSGEKPQLEGQRYRRHNANRQIEQWEYDRRQKVTDVDRDVDSTINSRRRGYQKPPTYNEAVDNCETEDSEVDESSSVEQSDEECDEEIEEERLCDEEIEEERLCYEENEEVESALSVQSRPRNLTGQPQTPESRATLNTVSLGIAPAPTHILYPPTVGYFGQFPVAPPGGALLPAVPHQSTHPFIPHGGQSVVSTRSFERSGPASVWPTDPPVYSHIVRCGYTPLPVGQVDVQPKPSEVAGEVSGNILSSGVDYMRR